jgi:hypothetical protein
VIPSVAASERGTAQTDTISVYRRGCGAPHGDCIPGSYKISCIVERLESLAIVGDSPVSEMHDLPEQSTRVPRDTRNPVGIWEDHLPRLNTTL